MGARRMTTLHIDIESHSACDLKSCGLFRYAEDPTTDLVAVAYASDSGPIHFWAPWESVPGHVTSAIRDRGLEAGSRLDVGRRVPDLLLRLFADRSVKIAAHNNQFERTMLFWPGSAIAQRYGLADIEAERMVCTMARAAVYGLPHSLQDAAKAMGSFPKRELGVSEMRYFSKPRKNGTRPTPTDEPDRYIQLALYCADDVRAERDLDHKIPPLTAQEQKVYELDLAINRRGVLVDLESVHNMRFLIDAYKEQLAALCRKLAEWIRANGYSQLTDLQAPTVVEALEDEKCPPAVREVLRTYSTYAMKAVSKYESMPLVACKDGRLRGLFRYYGAGPGRWSSSLVQLHNLMRPLIKDADTAIELARLRSLGALADMYDPLDPMRVIASCTRGMLLAPEGKDFISLDFSQIEAVIRSWLAGDEQMLNVFREGKVKSYAVQGSKMFGLPVSKIVDDGVHQLYTAAKIGDLACGFQGWEAAVAKMARQMGIKLAMEPVEIASRWREANTCVVKLWPALNDAAWMAVANPGEAYQIKNGRIAFKVVDRWLYMRLPSGRKIAYLDPECKTKVLPPTEYGGDEEPERLDPKTYEVRDRTVSYMGVDTYTRQWKRVDTYGGKLLQNATEGIARDILVNGIQNLESANYTTVATVHDQGLFEVDKDFGSMDEAAYLMTKKPAWAEGLPVKADGWRGKRFRK
jgi:DNA polymerase